ncbi:MAG: type I-U CRISPR-associated protein Csx17 [Candidatus Eremiobacteraeota bacterium]|nr:type I-U CRISPR-associated protein Csx17 [Candidatus Eremiobacteraeota bacterium]
MTETTKRNAMEIILQGCTAEPFISYFKALGVHRLLSEQLSPRHPDLPPIKGFWKNRVFHLSSPFSREEIVDFFINEYEPTPIVSPWYAGSGFHEGNNTTGIDAILGATDKRFNPYKETINHIQGWSDFFLQNLTIHKLLEIARRKFSQDKKISESTRNIEEMLKPLFTGNVTESKRQKILSLKVEDLRSHKDELNTYLDEPIELVKSIRKFRTQIKKKTLEQNKEKIIQACRNRLSHKVVEWVDVACAIGTEGKIFYPQVMGSGGNEGHLEFSGIFMQCLNYLFISSSSATSAGSLLATSLLDKISSDFYKLSTGFFDPGRAGGCNQGIGIETKDFPVNPWDIVFNLEGIIAWSSAVPRKYGLVTEKLLSSPFTVQIRGVGYASSSSHDETKAKAEVWTPLWEKPVKYAELKAFLREGRVEVSQQQRRSNRRARNSIEFAEAISTLGVDRGVTDFVRYSILERRGVGSYIALPAGVIQVKEKKEADLVRELHPILANIDFFLRKNSKNLPASFQNARRRIDQSIFELLLKGGESRAKRLIASLGNLQRLLSRLDTEKAGNIISPYGELEPRWIEFADDGSVEVRVAAAIASITSTGKKVGPLRINLVPVHKSNWSRQTAWRGNSIFDRLASVMQRRMMDAARLGCEKNPLWSRLQVSLDDVLRFIEGEFDPGLLEDLLFGFSLIKWKDKNKEKEYRDTLSRLRDKWTENGKGKLTRFIPRDYAVIKLLYLDRLTDQSGKEVQLKYEPGVIPLLEAGRLKDACNTARRRLFVAGLNPVKPKFPDHDSEYGTRMAASLLIPIGMNGVGLLKDRILIHV